MKKARIEEQQAEILRKLNNPLISDLEKSKLSDQYRKLINKKIRQFCKKAKR